jgi:hypothetical protein
MAFTHEGYRGSNSGELPFPVREERGNGGGDDADMRVPPVGEGREGKGVPVRVLVLLGCGLLQVLGRMVSPGPFSVFISSFSFSISVFFISFIHFSNLNQINSNQLCKVSKIQNNHTEQ